MNARPSDTKKNLTVGCDGLQHDAEVSRSSPAPVPSTAPYSLPICVVCEIDVRKHGPGYRCTNGCCPDCHRRFCTPGGNTEPGHGIDVERARSFIGAPEARAEGQPTAGRPGDHNGGAP